MSKPSDAVWRDVKDRDDFQCVSCGRRGELTFQHRQAVGAGGSKHKPTIVEGVVACMHCNAAFESYKQMTAVIFGWKVRRNGRFDVAQIPVLYPHLGGWHLLTADGGRDLITPAAARSLMVEAYGLDQFEAWRAAAWEERSLR